MCAVLFQRPSLAADISKWVDQRGRIHYGDHPPTWANPVPVKVQPNVIDTGLPTKSVPAFSRTPTLSKLNDTSPVGAPRERADIQA
ncbi:MAG: DUF4124 domain-containing protein, partial [Burkholderiales bacterium]|nr:DUF4124 domain-containing protein [Burkholderiales bacterium]